MITVRLNDICEFVSGNAWSSAKYSDEGVPIIRITNLYDGLSDFVYWPDSQYDMKYLVKKNDLLVSLSGTIKIYRWNGEDGLLNQRIVNVSINSKYKDIVNKDWLYYKIRTLLYTIEQRGKKAVINNISVNELKRIELQIPTLHEQSRIVTILEKIESIAFKKNEAITQLNYLARSLFLGQFKNYIDDKAFYIELKAIIPNIESGWSPNCDDLPRENEGQVAVLKQSAVTKRFFDPTQNKRLPENVPIRKECYVSKGDLLFSRKNTLELVGASSYVFDDVKNLLIPDTIFNLRYSQELVSGVYLYYLFNDENFRMNIRDLASGALVSMSNISKESLSRLSLPLPNINEQREFEEKIRVIQSKTINFQNALNLIERLLDSLMKFLVTESSFVNIDAELESLLNVIDMNKLSESEGSVKSIKVDFALRQRLIDKLTVQEFDNIDQYDKAKFALFKILSDEDALVHQEFDEEKEVVKLLTV